MLEQRRQQYLSLLDIDSYVPRRLLSGAAASRQLSEDQITPVINDSTVELELPANIEQKEAAIAAEVLKENIDSSQVLEKIVSTVDDEISQQTLTEKLSAQQAFDSDKLLEEKPSTNNEANLNFVLTVWRISDKLLVLDSREPGAAYPTDRLLQNILRTMGYPLAQLPASDIVRWPVFVNKNAMTKSISLQNQDAEQAKAMVQAYISAQISKQPVEALLCMGENAARFALDVDLGDGSEADCLVLNDSEPSHWNIPTVVTPSLFSMLQEPMLKAKAWASLQTIISKA